MAMPMSISDRTYQRHLRYNLLRGPAITLGTGLASSSGLASFVAVKSFGASEKEAIFISLAIQIGNLMGIFWARLMSGRRRLRIAFQAEFISFLVFIPIAFVTRPQAFIALIFLNTILKAPALVALAAVMRENYPARTLATTLGKAEAVSLASMALSALLFGYLLRVDAHAYWYLYPVCGFVGLLAAWQLRGIPERKPDARPAVGAPSIFDIYHILRRDRDFLRYQITYFIFGIGATIYTALLPLYLAQDLKSDHQQAAMALVVLQTALPVVTSPLWGRVIDRMNVLLLRGLFNILWGACPLLVIAFHTIHGAYLAQFLMGLTTGGSALIWALGINIYAKKADVSTYMGIHTTLTGLRGLIGPVVGLNLAWALQGSAAVPGYRGAFVLAALVMIAAGGYMIWEGRWLARTGRATTFRQTESAENPS